MKSKFFEYSIGLDNVIRNEIVAEYNSQFPDQPINKDDICLYYDRNWDTDSNNFSHASLYVNIQIEVTNPLHEENMKTFIKPYLEE